MAEGKKGSAMLPLIIVGATLFAFGAWQSTRPPEREVNQGFTGPAIEGPANPRTMQAPDAPPQTKDAAQRAAEDATVTDTSKIEAKIEAKIEKVPAKPSVLEEAWFMALRDGSAPDFRAKTLAALIAQQRAGKVNCSPTLIGKTDIELAETQTVSCLASDGSKIEGNFERGYKVADVGPLQSDGEIVATSPDNRTITIRKDGNAFRVEEEAAN